ncbi:glycosyltransferase family 25 protein [Phenylobacterium sp.]|uniref:glycosyltransferase family 25 protein n=1 Tax=Phenylobacterium sp. TaxID=1871053 RepID=UPI0025F85975|nr:glycosyltransferase family 25 protein [Phenylobacterium sp.]
MRCFYINLDSAAERRANLEASFRASAPAHWELIRIPALGPEDVADRPGSISGPEKGCFLSHRTAVAATADDLETVFIAEDDTHFSKRTFTVLEQLIEAAPDWDLLFTDQTFLDASTMLSCAKQYGRLRASGQFLLQDLARKGFAAASAYLVQGRSKAKVLAALDASEVLDLPYDLLLRRLVNGDRLVAKTCFPFLTTLSWDSAQSAIQKQSWDTRAEVIGAFRRMMFIDRDLDAMREEVRRLDERYNDDASRLAGLIFGAFISDAFPDKW